jgi:hypothetical protein
MLLRKTNALQGCKLKHIQFLASSSDPRLVLLGVRLGSMDIITEISLCQACVLRTFARAS